MKLGGFGVDRMITTQASLQAKFLMPVPPMYMEKISTEGTLSSMKISHENKHLVHLAWAKYRKNTIKNFKTLYHDSTPYIRHTIYKNILWAAA